MIVIMLRLLLQIIFRKAINSGDTDLIYHVILELQQREKPSNFHLIIREYPVASKLYTLYCRYHSHDSLSDWLQQVWRL